MSTHLGVGGGYNIQGGGIIFRGGGDIISDDD